MPELRRRAVDRDVLAEVRGPADPAPGPAPVNRSARGSPSRSSVATRTPPRVRVAGEEVRRLHLRPEQSTPCPRGRRPRPAARPAADDHLGEAVAVQVAGRRRTRRCAASARRRRSRRTASPASPAERSCRRTRPAAARRRTRPPRAGRPRRRRSRRRPPPARRRGSSGPRCRRSRRAARSPCPLNDPHPRPAALVRRDDEVGEAVAVEVAGRDEHAAGEARLERLARRRTSARVVAVEDPRPASRPGPGADDHVADAVAVEVAARHPHPAGERLLEREKLRRLGPSGGRP